jgi:predicted DNA-binding protein (UPF0251 family)
MRSLEIVSLSLEETEAFRLRFNEKLNQERAAEKMKTSQSTYQRILTSASEKIAEALTKGKAIQIEGGSDL